MYYTKGLIKGHSKDKKIEVVSIKFDCFISEDDLDTMLILFRESFNTIGEPLHYEINLESEDV